MTTGRWCAALAAASVALGVAPACLAPTGDERVSFDAVAAGPLDADGGALTVVDARGASITLTRASLTLGPLYLDADASEHAGLWRRLSPLGVRRAHAHEVGSARVVAEVLSQVTVDLLSGSPVTFPSRGSGTSERASALRLLFAPPPGAADAPPPTLVVEGRARGDDPAGGPFDGRFRGALTLDAGWLAARPDLHDLTELRTVSVRAPVLPEEGGLLSLRVDPRALFAGVDPSTIAREPADPADPGLRLLGPPRAGADAGQATRRLFENLRSPSSYAASWRAPRLSNISNGRVSTAAAPSPPAAQMPSTAERLPVRASSLAIVVTMRAPVAPNGWPSARLPPWTLKRAGSMRPTARSLPSRSFANASLASAFSTLSTCAANASWKSTRSASSSESPARSSALGTAMAGPMSS